MKERQKVKRLLFFFAMVNSCFLSFFTVIFSYHCFHFSLTLVHLYHRHHFCDFFLLSLLLSFLFPLLFVAVSAGSMVYPPLAPPNPPFPPLPAGALRHLLYYFNRMGTSKFLWWMVLALEPCLPIFAMLPQSISPYLLI